LTYVEEKYNPDPETGTKSKVFLSSFGFKVGKKFILYGYRKQRRNEKRQHVSELSFEDIKIVAPY
jgi:hypothetical protein